MATLQINSNPNGKFYALLGLLGLLILMALLLRNCNKPEPYVPINIKPDIERQDSFRTIIKYHDSTRISVLKRYREVTVLKDSTPCFTEIKFIKDACDTVIKVDSILIVALKGQITNDSVIQGKLIKKVGEDSLQITKLNKKLKRQKLITKFAFGIGAVLGGAVGIKVKD